MLMRRLNVFRARLVACGNEQIYGVDYGLTFSAVMELSTMKMILVFAMRLGVPARHGDIPNTYVKANKEEHLDIFWRFRRVWILRIALYRVLASRASQTWR